MKHASNAPSYSCRLWHDAGSIYVELASGLITKFPRTEGALSKVLSLLDREAKHFAAPRLNGKSKEKLPIEPKRAKPLVTIEERSRALEVLKKKGFV